MYRNNTQDEQGRRQLPPIGAERAARLAARNSLGLKPSLGGGGTDGWQNPSGSEHGCNNPLRVCNLWGEDDGATSPVDGTCGNGGLAGCLSRNNPWSWMGPPWSGAGGNNFGGGGTVCGWERDTFLESANVNINSNNGGMGSRDTMQDAANTSGSRGGGMGSHDAGETFTAGMGSQRFQSQQPSGHTFQHQAQIHTPPQQHQSSYQPQLLMSDRKLQQQQQAQVHPQMLSQRLCNPESPATTQSTYQAPTLLHRSTLGHPFTPDTGSTLFHDLLRTQERTCSLAQRIHDILPTDAMRRTFQNQLLRQQIQIEQQLAAVLDQKLDLVTKAMHMNPEVAHSYYVYQPNNEWANVGAALATSISVGHICTTPTCPRPSTPIPTVDPADISLDMSRMGIRGSTESTPTATSTPLQESLRSCPTPAVGSSAPVDNLVTMHTGCIPSTTESTVTGPATTSATPTTASAAAVAASSVQYNGPTIPCLEHLREDLEIL
ncbi:uncharacterized protein [Drosophila bipectinata]|uniref:uncharacterized protein n=1 Tax=Drosophila bipectinata TaxID=42026 RepID=UPI001C8A6092|nr:uncharacterized protein LOC122321026 [Drosophila bipectinata]